MPDAPFHSLAGGEVALVALLNKLASCLEDAEDPSEAVYLLARPLPDVVAVVLDSKFMTDQYGFKCSIRYWLLLLWSLAF